MTEQLTFDGVSRCGHVGARTAPDRDGDTHVHVCTLEPHDAATVHYHTWELVPRAHPVTLVVITGGRL